MGLETVTHISDLVVTNPVGGVDPKSQGDDHIRNIKVALKTDFPNITGVVSATQTALNGAGALYTADAAAAGMLADIAALTDPNADRVLFWDDSAGAVAGLAADGTTIAISGTTLATGSNVPLLNAANVFSLASGRWSTLKTTSATGGYVEFQTNSAAIGYLGAADQANGGGASATDVGLNALGTLALKGGTAITLNGVASSDFARLSQSNPFSAAGTQVIKNTSGAEHLRLGGVGGTNSPLLSWYSTGGSRSSYIQQNDSTDAFSFINERNGAMLFATNGTTRLDISSSGNFDFKAGTVTTNNASASEVGKAGAPARLVSSSGSTAASDQGGTIRFTGGSGQTFTLDGDPPTDAIVLLDNDAGASWTIAASGTLTWALTGGTGSRTLADKGLACAIHKGSGNWKIGGGGLS